MNCKYSLFLLLLFLSAPLLNAQINYASKADHLIGCWLVSGKSAVKSNQPEFGGVGDDRIVFQENFARPALPNGWAIRSADKSHTWYVNSFPIDDERYFQSVGLTLPNALTLIMRKIVGFIFADYTNVMPKGSIGGHSITNMYHSLK